VLDNAAADNGSAKLRSKLTNNPALLPGVDRRSASGRRYVDIVAAVAAEFGPGNPVALRDIAALRFTLEREQGDR